MADKVLRSRMVLDDSQFKRGLKGSQTAAQGFQNSMLKVGAAIAVAFSVRAVFSFMRASVEAYDVQQKAETQLLTALKGREDIQKRLIKDAQRLQGITLFGDEVTISGYAQLAMFIRNEDALKRLMPLVQDMATAFNMDLVSAANLVGKSLGSSTNALSRYGISIEGAVGSSERLESAIASLNDKVGGQAAEAAKTGIGAVTQLKNAWGDFGETLAGATAPALVSVANGLRDIVSAADEFAKLDINFWKKLWVTLASAAGDYATATRLLEDAVVDQMEAEKERGKYFSMTREELEKLRDEYTELLKTKPYKEYKDELDKINEAIASQIRQLEAQKKAIDDVAESLTKVTARSGISGMPSISDTGRPTDYSPVTQANALAADRAAQAWINYKNSLAEFDIQMRTTYEGMSAFTDSYSTFAEEMILVNQEMAMHIQQAFQSITNVISNSIADIVLGQKTFEEALRDFANSLIRMAINLMVTFLAQTIAAAISHGTQKGGVIGGTLEGLSALTLFSTMVPALTYLAEGGIATGPVAAMVGEYPGASSNPEVIAPLDKLKNMIGGGAQVVEIVGKVRGEDLHYIVQKHESKLNRYR